MAILSRLWRLKHSPTEVNPTENFHEGWKNKNKRRNRRIKKVK